MKAPFAPRTEAVPVPDLAQWFSDLNSDETPVWVVRAVDASELCRANDAKTLRSFQTNLVEAANALVAGDGAALSAFIGTGLAVGDVHGEYARRCELLTMASVDPVCTLDMAIQLGTAYPVIWFLLTNKILALTGMGGDLGKKP